MTGGLTGALGRLADKAMWVPGKFLTRNHMQGAGIGTSMAVARTYNRLRYAARRRHHLTAYREHIDALLAGNGPLEPAPVTLRDGWALDTRGMLPHLDRLLAETAPLIAERGGKKHSSAQQAYFRNLLFPGDIENNGSFLDFALSSPVLATIAQYMGTVPVLSKTRPPGLRFMESNQALDPLPDRPLEESQLYHRDLYDSPVVYVIVALRDITEESGPWTFLPKASSVRASERLGYRRRGVPYRITDEAMYRVVDPGEAVRFIAPRGSVLFIDSGACFHYGSRNALNPRYQMMYGFTTPCRTDLTQTFEPQHQYPKRSGDSELRRMVLE